MKRKSPGLLKFIAILLIYVGVSGIYTNIMLFSYNESNISFIQNYPYSLTKIEKALPFILYPLIIISAIFMLKNKIQSINIFVIYLFISIIFSLYNFLNESWFSYYGWIGVISTFFGITINISIYFYLKNIAKNGVLS